MRLILSEIWDILSAELPETRSANSARSYRNSISVCLPLVADCRTFRRTLACPAARKSRWTRRATATARKSTELSSRATRRGSRVTASTLRIRHKFTWSLVNKCSHSLCDFKHPQQANTPQHRHAKWRHYLSVCQNHLGYASDDDETIEAIKERYEVSLETQAVHFHQHFDCEEGDEEAICDF